MRRQTTKAPSGPASAAMPMPPASARIRNSATMMSTAFIRLRMVNDDIAMGIMLVAMVMIIKCERTRLCRAEQFEKRRVVADMLGVARTADMMIEAHDMVGRGHHQMQVM